jgi:VWFA-related protein
MTRAGRVSAIVAGAVLVAVWWAMGSQVGPSLTPALSAQQTPAPPARSGPPQAPPQPGQQTPPVFRGGVNFVAVDAFPRRDGKIIEGLTKADFQILEDGKPQAVETFEFIHVASIPADAERRDPSNQADAERQAADPHNRVFVVYLDLAHTTLAGSYEARQPVVDFLTRTIGATDLFGFMTAETAVSQLVFGRRTEAIDAQLATFWTWGQSERLTVVPRTAYEQRLETCGLEMRPDLKDFGATLIRLSREDQLQTSLENLMSRLRDLRDERKNILFISEGWVPLRPHLELLRNNGGDVPGMGIGTPSSNVLGQGTRAQGTMDRSWCETQVARLANIDFDLRFRALLTSANRANVSFYPIDVGGLKGPAEGDARVASTQQAAAKNASNRGSVETLKTLAENTDGFAVVNTNDLTAGIKRVSDDLSSYYLLGYYSTNSVNDGRFRRIDVKVNAPRAAVSARRGYFAPTAEMAAAASAAATPAAAAIDAELARLGRLRPDADVFSYGVPTDSGLDVVVELAARQLAQGRWSRGADVRVVASAGGGDDLVATGRVEAGARSLVLSVPMDRTRPGPWRATVTVSGDGERVQDQLEVTPLTVQLVGPAMVYRATPSPRSPLRPVGDFQLARAERLHVEWPLLQDLAARSVRLLDRKGQPLGAELPFAAPPADRHVLALDLPMASLPEGDFVLELTATSGAGVSERRVLAFRVVR